MSSHIPAPVNTPGFAEFLANLPRLAEGGLVIGGNVVNVKSGPEEEIAQMARNLADRCASLWREVHVHRDLDGCPDRSHVDLLEWLEAAEVTLHRFAHLTATRQEG